MKLILSADEVARAVCHYAAKKVGGTTADDFRVTIHWRAKGATVERVHPIPVLNDAIDDKMPHYAIPAMDHQIKSSDPFEPIGVMVDLSAYRPPEVTK